MEARRGIYAPQVTDDLLSDMVQAIVAEVDPEQVILFGSRARGDARKDSDVDLVVVRVRALRQREEPTPGSSPPVESLVGPWRCKGHPGLQS